MDVQPGLLFDEALAVLRGWLGRRVEVCVDGAAGPARVACMSGTLKPGGQRLVVAGDEDPDLYEFGFHELRQAQFMIHRTWFHAASYDDGRLIVAMGDHGDLVVKIEAR
ncbi:MAG: hypothetical protein M3296_05455 [Actinomycetota bacterium]|nr:hypothetical protein [Actinomycetota bacterium]